MLRKTMIYFFLLYSYDYHIPRNTRVKQIQLWAFAFLLSVDAMVYLTYIHIFRLEKGFPASTIVESDNNNNNNNNYSES